ncbi:MAG: hypothetical protein JO131_09505, partial [Gammaproteobacteria bacterium]|nr:hypothetical protein [Gammaproteobacteria bacterium]
MKVIRNIIFSCGVICLGSYSYADTTQTQSNINTPQKNPPKVVNESAPVTTAPEQTDDKSPLTGNFDITTNYVFRGVSNSNNNPAFQGGLTYTFLTTGIYLNVWGSNVDFLDPQGHIATVEADTIIGITNSINDNWSYNINFDRYNYPKASAANYNELIAALTYKIFTATIGESLNVYGSHSNGTYYNGLFAIPLSEKIFHFSDLQAQASWGHYSLPRNAGLYSYSDVMVGLQKTIKQYVMALQYTNTNHKGHTPGLDTGTLIATLTVNF